MYVSPSSFFKKYYYLFIYWLFYVRSGPTPKVNTSKRVEYTKPNWELSHIPMAMSFITPLWMQYSVHWLFRTSDKSFKTPIHDGEDATRPNLWITPTKSWTDTDIKSGISMSRWSWNVPRWRVSNRQWKRTLLVCWKRHRDGWILKLEPMNKLIVLVNCGVWVVTCVWHSRRLSNKKLIK